MAHILSVMMFESQCHRKYLSEHLRWYYKDECTVPFNKLIR